MSDDEADPELLALLRESLGMTSRPKAEISSDTGVLKDAEYIYSNAIDVFIDMYGTKAAATAIYNAMQERGYSTETWSQHELHPKVSEGFTDVEIVNFVFTMDLLNFSFWSELPEEERYQVEYRGQRWTGYNSLVACLRRALDEGVPVTTPRFWRKGMASDDELRSVFRSATPEEIPLLSQRIAILREAADVLHESFGDPEEPIDIADDTKDINEVAEQVTTDALDAVLAKVEPEDNSAPADAEDPALAIASDSNTLNTEDDHTAEGAPNLEPLTTANEDPPTNVAVNNTAPPKPDLSVIRLIQKSGTSAGKLVNLLANHFPCFRDETRFDGRKVRLLKRAQIFVADLWAAFNGTGYGEFHDIDHLTMFADYRVPQILHSLGVLSYSPPLQYRITDLVEIPSGHSWEVQLRGCSIWAIELIRREILQEHPEAEAEGVNAVLIDFFLYDLAKEREKERGVGLGTGVPHHRTRGVSY